MMKAIAFGEDGLCGDSGFSPNKEYLLEATDESTFEELSAAWLKQEIEVNLEGEPVEGGGWSFLSTDGTRFVLQEGDKDLTGMLAEEGTDMPTGFWILTAENVDTAFIVDEVEVWNDSMSYTVNRTLKTMINRLSTRIVGDASVIESPRDPSPS